MRQTKQIMGMPVIVILPGKDVDDHLFGIVFDFFRAVDEQFSPFKATSEVAAVNRSPDTHTLSKAMQTIVELAEQTKQSTGGLFDVWHEGYFDPSGIVKGWAIEQAAELLKQHGLRDFYVEAGGDIYTAGHNARGEPWAIGIRNPFDREQIVKVLNVSNAGVATSGTAIRGQHIYNPLKPGATIDDIASLTVVAASILDADRFATAAFAAGKKGIALVEKRPNMEGYMIDTNGVATYTSHFERYL